MYTKCILMYIKCTNSPTLKKTRLKFSIKSFLKKAILSIQIIMINWLQVNIKFTKA